MLIAVHTRIIVEVRDEEQGQDACVTIEGGLEHQMASFPEGDVVGVKVDKAEPVSAEEAQHEGWTE